MEGILILVFFAGVNIFSAWLKQKKKHEAEQRGSSPAPPPTVAHVDPLQELLRKFEDAQKKRNQEASQAEEEFEGEEEVFDKELVFEEHYDSYDEDEMDEVPQIEPIQTKPVPQAMPEKKYAMSQKKQAHSEVPLAQKQAVKEHDTHEEVKLRSILDKAAYYTISQEYISEEALQEELQIGRTLASSLIQQMEYLGICGKNVGESYRSVLVENEDELKNVLKKAKNLSLLKNPTSFAVRKQRKFVFSKTEAEKGVLWSKILDEPRFKKRWTPNSR